MNIENIPLTLRNTPRWIVWKRTEREGKPDKPPIDYRTGRPGSVNDPAIWMSFEKACEEAKNFSGLGFAFSPHDDFAGIDLDKCIDEEGEIEPWAERIVMGIQSYTERSPSGRGLHILLCGKLPPEGDRNRSGGFGPSGYGVIEMYDHARYFTVTGDHLTWTPSLIENRGEELVALYREVFPQEGKEGRATPDGPAPSDDFILRMARSAWNKDKFIALYDDGDLARYQGNWSSADLALCSHLAFWCKGDTNTIDRLFRASKLMRDKWDERRGATTYGLRTIEKAASNMRAFYDPGAPKGEGVDGETPPIHRTDLGNARRLVRMHGDSIRYCHPWGKWLVWAEDHWRIDETDLVARLGRDIIAELHAEAAASPDEAVRKELAIWALKSEAEARLNSMVSLARQEKGIPVVPGELDAWPWLLNCSNGTLDLKTGTLGPHVKRDHLMKLTGAPYDAEARCPLWDKFLHCVMGGDQDMVDFLRRAVGYSLTGDVREHTLFFLYGRGRNGKSTFLNTLQSVFGDYAITINADLLTAKNQDEHPTGVADLQGRRFVATLEVEDGRKMAESLVKTLTGGDRIRARRMRQDFYEFDPTHKLFLAANHKPPVRGTDDGIWRRIRLLPFSVQIPEREVDRTLSEKLRAEAPGILAWAVSGCLEWQLGGLKEPAAVLEATADYRAEMDTLGDFLEVRCLISEGLRDKSSDLYRAYVEWSKETGNFQLSANKFGRLLTDRGFGSDKTNSIAYRLGIAVREIEEFASSNSF